jgi:hypothetical protein
MKNADAGLTKLTTERNANAGITFFHHSGIIIDFSSSDTVVIMLPSAAIYGHACVI